MSGEFMLVFLGVVLGYCLSAINTHWALLILGIMVVISIIGGQRTNSQ